MAKSRSKQDSIKQQTLKTFQRVLSDLTNSPHFSVLKSVPLAQFTGKKLSSEKAFNGITVEGLVKLAKAEVSPITALTTLQLKHLIQSLWPLLGATAVEPLGTSRSEPVQSGAPDERLSLSPVELENRLEAASKLVRSSPTFTEIRSKKLGEFWDKSWARAPFEEALTVGQFAAIDVTTLVKKRSFNPKKALLLLDAVDRALGVTHETKPLPLTPRAVPTILSDARVEKAGWGELHTSIPAYAQEISHLIGSVIKEASTLTSPSAAGRIIAGLPHLIGGEEFLVWWFSRSHPLSLVARILSKREENV